ncbi:erythromycin esterase family protein [Paenibacillus campi]|uniref:erythromycin esterase family protein n=1 Tax=Paenibacillus campi TaxID=3106031 RepID=UPI002AFE6694|nr:erythromycin esterase family protein [Paenibacillus sp. SGZ-1009]
MFFKSDHKQKLAWTRQQCCPIVKSSAESTYDFSSLTSILKHKRVVWLGENGHQIAEVNHLKAELVRFLYEQLDFKVVIFESGIGECFAANINKQHKQAQALMQQSIFSLWHTEEMVPLFQMLSNTDLQMAGMDMQPSADMAHMYEVIAHNEQLSADGKEHFRTVQHFCKHWYAKMSTYRAKHRFRKQLPADLKNEYELAKQNMQQRCIEVETELHALLAQTDDDDASLFQFLLHYLKNLQQFIAVIDQPVTVYIERRDQQMAENVNWLLHHYYPHQKAIILAHNNHIFKSTRSVNSFCAAGSQISDDLLQSSYYIGTFMYEGETHTASGVQYKLSKPPKNSVEAYMNASDHFISFMDVQSVAHTESYSWLNDKVYFMDSGTIAKRMIVKQEFDGLFFIKTISLPHYIHK